MSSSGLQNSWVSVSEGAGGGGKTGVVSIETTSGTGQATLSGSLTLTGTAIVSTDAQTGTITINAASAGSGITALNDAEGNSTAPGTSIEFLTDITTDAGPPTASFVADSGTAGVGATMTLNLNIPPATGEITALSGDAAGSIPTTANSVAVSVVNGAQQVGVLTSASALLLPQRQNFRGNFATAAAPGVAYNVQDVVFDTINTAQTYICILGYSAVTGATAPSANATNWRLLATNSATGSLTSLSGDATGSTATTQATIDVSVSLDSQQRDGVLTGAGFMELPQRQNFRGDFTTAAAPGVLYSLQDVVFDTINTSETYICIASNAAITGTALAPSADSSNWRLLATNSASGTGNVRATTSTTSATALNWVAGAYQPGDIVCDQTSTPAGNVYVCSAATVVGDTAPNLNTPSQWNLLSSPAASGTGNVRATTSTTSATALNWVAGVYQPGDIVRDTSSTPAGNVYVCSAATVIGDTAPNLNTPAKWNLLSSPSAVGAGLVPVAIGSLTTPATTGSPNAFNMITTGTPGTNDVLLTAEAGSLPANFTTKTRIMLQPVSGGAVPPNAAMYPAKAAATGTTMPVACSATITTGTFVNWVWYEMP